MADLLIAISMMFAGAALALGGFALGQSVERRRWLEWVRPKPKLESGLRFFGADGRLLAEDVVKEVWPKRADASVTYAADGAVTYREARDA